jgi:hypothetical protein
MSTTPQTVLPVGAEFHTRRRPGARRVATQLRALKPAPAAVGLSAAVTIRNPHVPALLTEDP